ncbi:diguanylate cyclase [Adhaeretor mobilis]|uniref:diguanylate cyclase n=1 Tax=Adhaeretor mobilis TaxID=1930276 RepID=A0A517MXX3_9BACT|nr:diguanylate cyclase [Adhaeretor mobilis]QDS99721.1 putative diguanylate cyclase YdaM [Adhaeretor mobilis]
MLSISDTLTSDTPEVATPGAHAASAPAEGTVTTRMEATQTRVAEISSLLSALENAAAESGLSVKNASAQPVPTNEHENKLVQVRLGMASGLFNSLKHKHPQSASHCLRVALGCSSWAFYKKLDDESHDAVELAALMHDLGKMGVPDSILLKPGRLNAEEIATVLEHRRSGVEILASCCSSQRVLDAVKYSTASFDGTSGDLPLKGEQIPVEARMIAIIDAFDAMTTDHLYRQAMPRDRAIAELFECSGTQFDPVLVKQFVDLLSQRQDLLTEKVASRWLGELNTHSREMPWQLGQASSVPADLVPSRPATKPQAINGHSLFEQKLIDAMHDGVMFVDEQSRIQLWSKGAERLTGVSAGAAQGRIFTPDLLDMCNSDGRRVANDSCPVAQAIKSSSQIRQRLQLLGRQGTHVAIDLHAVPVHGTSGSLLGATVMLHDAQPEASLEEKCEALHAEVTKDPMTKVANRAEFDRMQALFIDAHEQACMPCSLIMVDIDHFKSINDTFGHQAGDEAIITVANLLKSMCRSGDLVARYGGEEFAVLCADCGNATAASRADQIRRKLSETPHSVLGNKRITASFGVTELQAGDNPESMLRRADRALLMAKEQGRNQVVQLGNGMEEQKKKKKKWWSLGGIRGKAVIETKLSSMVPSDIAIEKLRGFISDHKAKVLSTKENRVDMEITSETVAYQRRNGDREIRFIVEIEFSEERFEKTNGAGFGAGKQVRTHTIVKVRPKRGRSRRNADTAERARLLVQSLKAYLMAREDDGTPQDEPRRFEPTVV